MQLMEAYYYITNKPYFVVTVLHHARRVKRFIQLASSEKAGTDFFLIDKGLKAAWEKPKKPVIDGLKFIVFADLNNAIPLVITKEINYDTNGIFIKETESEYIYEDEEKQKIETKSGKANGIIEIRYPPTVLFHEIDAVFLKQIMASPPDKWEQLKWVFIAGIIVAGLIIWQLTSSGGLQHLMGH